MSHTSHLLHHSRSPFRFGVTVTCLAAAFWVTPRWEAWVADTSVSLNAAEIPASAVAPENAVVAGHSYHGDAFDQGPRQAAYLMGTTGQIHFPVTSQHSQVQAWINQGVGQLHGFWYFEAERSFRQAAQLDPDCAIAYWGMAMANTNNETRARKFIEEAVKRKEQASPREKLYIDALANWYAFDTKGEGDKKRERAQKSIKDYEKIVYENPADLEAKAFLALQTWQVRNDLPITNHLAMSALLDSILAKNPQHPCHHFVIHLWDYERREQALASAAQCGQVAPGIAHMWHMPGHIYSGLKRYADAAFQQEASARVDHAYMMRDMVMPDQIHNFAHNNEWLCRNLIFLGRMHDVINVASNMASMPMHPKYNRFPSNGSQHFGRLRLWEAYSQFELWEKLIESAHQSVLSPTGHTPEQIKRLRALARAYDATDHLAKFNETSAIIRGWRERLAEDRELEMTRAEARVLAKEPGKPRDEKAIESARKSAVRSTDETLRQLDRAIDEITAIELARKGEYAEAIRKLNTAGGASARELARLRLAAGQKEEARKELEKYVSQHAEEVLPLAWLVELLIDLNDEAAARTRFEELRAVAHSADLDAPALQRISNKARAWGFADDWRISRILPTDIGARPTLASLGPIQWVPPASAAWQLPGHLPGSTEISTVSSRDYRGKPTIVIFYLGAGCLHCVEQIQKFLPKVNDFQAAGISVVAISTDDLSDLKKSIDRFGSQISMPLLSDDSLEVFKRFKAYDDFENQPIHGTFLIDGQGLIRWHDLGADPFMDVDFLLEESQRLLHPTSVKSVTYPQPRPAGTPASALEPLNQPAKDQPQRDQRRKDRGSSDPSEKGKSTSPANSPAAAQQPLAPPTAIKADVS
ncbi:alkyl hydroperoxide reductase/ Thiol specific antioxidant/ Mal allergen [Planctopirus limnophila DSM 3776]|uniref:Alkyl hydroperoxide reductase/ Thiol specific antioxidant/ Mal allergen n=1 Tax=Planctopirus limnophila (strain ATCC 43296 / DSM 3776 / IFAM 1008 / Mu 290) TaxID=521674 RepID=D5SXD0_PLAL2|nr:redoxin domain-containing protein [Planctopirus limnophila]ADG69752.1 alkyl hydroperoxide reductase/ Thiol specific antioxidant/ Mal allergen [Planctopirus limnophila DSM 3776]